MISTSHSPVRWLCGLTCVAALLTPALDRLTFVTLTATAADAPAADAATADKQRSLIAVLRSDASLADKAITCKRLAVYGTAEAVPALAPLLANPDLASWARIALEVIPDPAADAALRTALGQLQGRLLIGTINSIGVRRDAQAVPGLLTRLKDADAEVASAAAVALGHIGGDEAAAALAGALRTVPEPAISDVAQGGILCAEGFLARGQADKARHLYDTVRAANVPKQRVLEAIRGAILARGAGGIPLLLEQLRAQDLALFGMGLHTARELPGRNVTEALRAEVSSARPDRQVPLLLAVADRADAVAAEAVLAAAASGAKPLRLVALGLLENLPNPGRVPLLMQAAVGDDVEVAKAAKATLGRLPGKDAETFLLAQDLGQTTPKTRQLVMELAGMRHITAALPAVKRGTADADPAVRRAAVVALGSLGDAAEAADFARLLGATASRAERAELEKALLALCNRAGNACVPHLLPLARSQDAGLRVIALHALASVGGADALAAVKVALDDPDAAVQDEAVSTLTNWPNNWPDDVGVAEPLLALARDGKTMSLKVRGLRGYLQYIQEDQHLKDVEKLAKVNEARPLLQRPEEQRLAIALLGALPTAGSLEALAGYAAESATAEEACLALVNLAGGNKLKDASKDARRKALQLVVDTTKNAATRKKAEDALNALR